MEIQITGDNVIVLHIYCSLGHGSHQGREIFNGLITTLVMNINICNNQCDVQNTRLHVIISTLMQPSFKFMFSADPIPLPSYRLI